MARLGRPQLVGARRAARARPARRARAARRSGCGRAGRPRRRPTARGARARRAAPRARAARARPPSARAPRRARRAAARAARARRAGTARCRRRRSAVRACGEQRVDLRVGELGVLADARSARRPAGSRPAGAPGARARRRRDAGERLEALVDLQRVGRHRDRPLAAGAQPLGDGEGQRRLARRRSARRSPARKARKRPRGRSIVRRVSVRIGCGLSTGPDPRLAAIEAGSRRTRRSAAPRADVVCVFASGAHLAAPEATLEGVHEALAPPVLVGCGAGGVVGDGREVERGTAVAVWAATLGDGRAEAFHLDVTQGADAIAVGGLPELDGRDRASSCSPTPTRSRPTPCSPSWRAALPASRSSAASPARARPTATPRCSSTTPSSRAARSACASRASRSCRASPRAPRPSARS